ncbi:MAG: hypothetical protein AVDCRST_MAG06-3373, partial [uncultured Nocardioides sp.]
SPRSRAASNSATRAGANSATASSDPHVSRSPSMMCCSTLPRSRRRARAAWPSIGRAHSATWGSSAGLMNASRSRGMGGASSTRRSSGSGARAAASTATAAPIECPTSVSGPASSRWTTRSRTPPASLTAVERPSAGERPWPGRSTASTRCVEDSARASGPHAACELPSPCTHSTAGASRGPPRSATCTGPSTSSQVEDVLTMSAPPPWKPATARPSSAGIRRPAAQTPGQASGAAPRLPGGSRRKDRD